MPESFEQNHLEVPAVSLSVRVGIFFMSEPEEVAVSLNYLASASPCVASKMKR